MIVGYDSVLEIPITGSFLIKNLIHVLIWNENWLSDASVGIMVERDQGVATTLALGIDLAHWTSG